MFQLKEFKALPHDFKTHCWYVWSMLNFLSVATVVCCHCYLFPLLSVATFICFHFCLLPLEYVSTFHLAWRHLERMESCGHRDGWTHCNFTGMTLCYSGKETSTRQVLASQDSFGRKNADLLLLSCTYSYNYSCFLGYTSLTRKQSCRKLGT